MTFVSCIDWRCLPSASLSSGINTYTTLIRCICLKKRPLSQRPKLYGRPCGKMYWCSALWLCSLYKPINDVDLLCNRRFYVIANLLNPLNIGVLTGLERDIYFYLQATKNFSLDYHKVELCCCYATGFSPALRNTLYSNTMMEKCQWGTTWWLPTWPA